MPLEDSEEQFLRPAQGLVRRHGRDGRRWLRASAIVLLAGTATLFGYSARKFLTRSHRLAVRDITILGADRAEAQLLAAVRPIALGRNLFALDLARVDSQLRNATPWVRYVTLRRLFPDRIEIRITEHDAVARDDRGSLLTRDGALLPQEPGLATDAELPRISGALTTAESRARLVELLALLERGNPPLAPRVTTIRALRPDDLVVELNDRPYQIHLGVSQFEERLNRYHNVETLLAARYGSVQSVDLRYRDRVVVGPVPTAVSGG